jgi:hypothetical protein
VDHAPKSEKTREFRAAMRVKLSHAGDSRKRIECGK